MPPWGYFRRPGGTVSEAAAVPGESDQDQHLDYGALQALVEAAVELKTFDSLEKTSSSKFVKSKTESSKKNKDKPEKESGERNQEKESIASSSPLPATSNEDPPPGYDD